MKKVGSVPTGKKPSSGHVGKNTPKLGSTPSSGGKLPTVSTNSYASSSYKTPKSNKSSSFGIIWLPSRKRNKHKDSVYNSHKYERPGERTPSMYNFMSGDSSNQDPFLKKKDEDSDLLVPQHSRNIPVAVASAGAVAASEIPPKIVNTNPEENQEFIKRDKEDSKEGGGDSYDTDKKSDKDYLENDEKDKKTSNVKSEKEKLADNVDSVFLRSPPPHKTRSTASTVEEEDCGIKCLYYTLQCCDCVLM